MNTKKPYDINKFYNSEIKDEFLQNYENEGTQTTLSYIFYKSRITEVMKKKDLSEFTVEDLEEVLYELEPLNKTVSASYGRMLNSYISWTIKKGYQKSNINPLTAKTTDYYERFVSKKKLFLSYSELKEIENNLVNAQDSVILYLLFEGVNGEGNTEILNLKKQDVNFDTNELKLLEVKKNGEQRSRTIKVSDTCIRLVKQAINQNVYQNRNGNAVNTRGTAEVELVNNDFVIRPVNRRVKDTNAPADKHTLFRRVTVISEEFDLPYLSMKNIERSGMIKMARDLYLENPTLEKDGKMLTGQLSKVAEHFGRRKVNVGGVEYFHLTPLREFLNLDTINELYEN